METQVSSLLDLMRSNTVALPIIQGSLRQLKADIKHKHVPQVAVASIFDIIRLTLVPTEYLDLGFSTLTHLTKRLIQQRQIPLLELQARRTIPLLFELFDHEKERIRGRAVQALGELCHISFAVFNNVENILRDEGLRSQSKRIIPAVCEWIIKMHQEKVLDSIHNYTYTALLVECLKHNEAIVVVAAKNALIQLYRDAEDLQKDQLKSKLRQRQISEPVMEDIIAHIISLKDITTTLPINPEPQPTRPRGVNRAVIEVKALRHRPAENSEAPNHPATTQPIQVTEAPPAVSTSSLSKPTTSSSTPSMPGKPIVPSAATSLPGKSTLPTTTTSLSGKSATTTATTSLPKEPSEVDVQPLPYVPKTSPAELEAANLEPLYVESAKDMEATFADMLPHFAGKETPENWARREQNALKIRRLTRGNAPEDYLPQYIVAIKSVSDGLVKGYIARKLKQSLDPMVELISCVTFSTRISQHLLNATQDKNVQPRLYASEWLMIVLTRYGRQRTPLDQNLDNLTKSISNGLNDRNEGVREAMRPTFWAYARLWNDKSKNIISNLDKKQQDSLLSDITNPFPQDWFAAPTSATPAPAKSKSSSKPSIRDTIAQQRLQKNAALSRPGSAADVATPARDISARMPARPVSSMLTTRRPVLASSTGSMSSAPVRPNRLARKPDTKAEAKVDMKFDVDNKADGLLTRHLTETPATKPRQTFDTRTPAKILAKATPTPVATVESVTDSELLPNTEPVAIAPKISAKATLTPFAPVESVPDSESLPNTEPEVVAPDTHKRVSWSEDELPVEFSSWKPPNEVSFALIGKTPTDPVDTITRNPVNGKTTAPVGELPSRLNYVKSGSSDCPWVRCPSDGTSLPVEPSELPASEITDLSVDGPFNIPAPEVAAAATPKAPRRSSLKSSNQPNITKEHRVTSQATSNTARDKTETTALTSIEADSQTPEFGIASRLSQSPRPLASRKEGIKSAGDSRRLKVYEDEEQMSEDIWLQLAAERGSPPPSPTLGAKAVLGERPVNTDIPKRRNSFSAKMTTDQNVSVHQTRQYIGRVVPRIQDGTLDHKGFKHLRELITKDNLWSTGEEGQPVADDLIQSLSFIIQGDSPYSDMDHEKLRLLRLHAVYTLTTLYHNNPIAVGRWSQHILRSVAVSYGDYPNFTQPLPLISLMMLRLAEHMLDLADQQRNLDTLFKLLEKGAPLEQNILALQLLTTALDRGHEGVDDTTEVRLGCLTCVCIGSFDTDVRMAGTNLAAKMFEYVKPESRFWQLLVELSEEQKNLVTYYISKT
ncbi:MAG: hypothetical protein Q9195_003612 [Heterodermia aff. obscurata]